MIKNYKIYFNTFFIILIIIFLLNSKLLSNFVWTASSLFIDFKIPLEWLRCHSLGINLLTLEALNCGDRTVSQFNYGQAFLHLPYNDLLDNFYRNFSNIKVLPVDIYPSTKWVKNTNQIHLSVKVDNRNGRIIILSVIDNLIKGQTGQAIQNLNLISGIPMNNGLEMVNNYP